MLTGAGLLVGLLALVPTAGAAVAEENVGSAHSQATVRVYGAIGSGLPDLAHGELGYFVSPRLTLEAHAHWIVFNPLVGLGATYALGKALPARPPRHAGLLSAQVLVNPTLGGLELQGGGETLAALVAAYGGYGFLADNGFYLRVLAGGLLYSENGFAMGPNATVSLGWAF